MNAILWIGYLIFILPLLIALLCVVFNVQKASQGRRKPTIIIILFIIGFTLLILSVRDIHIGIFTGFKFFSLFITKLALGIFSFALALIAFIGLGKRNSWNKRITAALDKGLGEKIKQFLVPEALYYSVDNTSITFLNSDNKKETVTFEHFGYQPIPAIYADTICKWIKHNIVQNENLYEIEEVFEEYESWDGGSNDYIEIKKTYGGYESKSISGDPGHRTIKHITYGYRLIHNSYKKQNISKEKTLNKW